MSEAAAIIVFARAPVAGSVKTRLIPALGPAGAAALYGRLLAQVVHTTDEVPGTVRYLFAADPTALAYFRAVLAAPAWRIELQGPGDLGARMADAFERVLLFHSCAILIGSDLIDIQGSDLCQALAALDEGSEAVLGPSADGGYWLIGLRRAQAELFECIEWGTAGVFAATWARVGAAGIACAMVAERHDIDRVEDLEEFAGRIAGLPPELGKIRDGDVAPTGEGFGVA